MRAHLSFVPGNLFHHAIEMLIKASLSKSMTLEELKNLGHKLGRLWEAFKGEFPGEDLGPHDPIIGSLDKFEQIRYPDRLTITGAALAYEWEHAPSPITGSPQVERVPQYGFAVADVDRLVTAIFRLNKYNPAVFIRAWTKFAQEVVFADNPCSAELDPASASQPVSP